MAAKKSSKKSEALAVKESEAIAAFDYGDEEGEGFEGQTTDDTLIPFISVLQSNSPQVGDEDNYPDAKQGMLFNTATEEVSKEVDFVPAYTEHVYVEWKPRDEGGGFVAKHDIYSDVVKKAKAEQDFGKYKHGDNDLVETFYVYGALFNDEGPTGGAVIAFTSTKIKAYKSWNTKIRGFQIQANGRRQTPPIFAHSVKLATVKQSNKHGAFYNFVLKPANETIKKSLLAPTDPRFEAARQFRDMIKSGEVKADTSKGDDGKASDSSEEFDEF